MRTGKSRKSKAEERLQRRRSEAEYIQSKAALARAMARLKVKGKYNSFNWSKVKSQCKL